jgi:hypothetical protein
MLARLKHRISAAIEGVSDDFTAHARLQAEIWCVPPLWK